MPVFRYQALDQAGKNVRGQIDAESARAVREKLRQEKLFVTTIKETHGGNSSGDDPSILGVVSAYIRAATARVSIREVATITRQLATLVQAGIPLVESLTALVEQTENEKLQQILSAIRDDVNEGKSMADALRPYPAIFNDLFVNMVRAGESSGTLEHVLNRLADFLESQALLRGKITAALAYPAIMMLAMIGVVAILFVVVVPKIIKIFEQSGMDLPLYTRILVASVQFMQSYWWVVILFFMALTASARYYVRTPAGKVRWDTIKFKVPMFRRLVLYIALSRFARTLGTLLKNGVEMRTSLQIVGAVVGNSVLQDVIEKTRIAVTEGATLAAPLKASGLFPPMVVHMVAVGEKSGELEDMLLRVAETYEADVESYILILTSLLEPIMIIVMASLVGFILISILLPMFQMNTLV